MKIVESHKFRKSFNSLDISVKRKTQKQFNLFLQNVFHPSLNTEKLEPKNKNIWDGLVKTANDIQNWITTLCQDIEERNIAINYVLQRYPKEKLLIEALKISTAITDGAESVLKTKRKIQKQDCFQIKYWS